MARCKHRILKAGTIFINKKGEKVEIVEYSHFKNGNYYYDCMDLETGETKIIQYSNLKSGNFTFQARYTYSDRQLYFVLRRAYDHIAERLRHRKSYADVRNRFENFEEFYNFFILYFEENPHLYDDFIIGKLEIDKDLLSEFYLKSGKLEMKEYSEDTILLVTKNENNSEIRKAIHSGDMAKIESLIQEIFRRRKEKRPNAETFSL